MDRETVKCVICMYVSVREQRNYCTNQQFKKKKDASNSVVPFFCTSFSKQHICLSGTREKNVVVVFGRCTQPCSFFFFFFFLRKHRIYRVEFGFDIPLLFRWHTLNEMGKLI